MVLPADNHVMLVQRMLGSSQLGTGGSSGYLYRTIFPFITVVIPVLIIVLGVVIIKQLDIFNHPATCCCHHSEDHQNRMLDGRI